MPEGQELLQAGGGLQGYSQGKPRTAMRPWGADQVFAVHHEQQTSFQIIRSNWIGLTVIAASVGHDAVTLAVPTPVGQGRPAGDRR